VAWAGDKPRDFGKLPSCALFLGAAEGIALFYDPDKKQTLRVPNAKVIVATRRDKDRC
jgi:hypothetical protein